MKKESEYTINIECAETEPIKAIYNHKTSLPEYYSIFIPKEKTVHESTNVTLMPFNTCIFNPLSIYSLIQNIFGIGVADRVYINPIAFNAIELFYDDRVKSVTIDIAINNYVYTDPEAEQEVFKEFNLAIQSIISWVIDCIKEKESNRMEKVLRISA